MSVARVLITVCALWFILLFDSYKLFIAFQFVAKSLLLCVVAIRVHARLKQNVCKRRISPENKSVFITGCDRGFGLELAKKLDSSGYKVFAGCLFPNAESAAELKKNSTCGLHVVQLDVTSNESVLKARDYVRENLENSQLWAVVNNAGIHQGFDIGWGSIDPFENCLDVNALGPVQVSNALLPLLTKCQGRIVTVASIAGRIILPNCFPYVMSKVSAVGFNECLKQEAKAFGVKVISIEPEFFRTSLVAESMRSIDTLASQSESVNLYGKEYAENLKRKTQRYTVELACPNTSLVINAMFDAISLEYPCHVYRPFRNYVVGELYELLNMLPSSINTRVIENIQIPWIESILFLK